MAVTRLWFFTLKPTTAPSDPAFLQLWADVLALCARYSPSPAPSTSPFQTAILSQSAPQRAHHFLFQSTTTTLPSPSPSPGAPGPGPGPGSGPVFVLISSYPSLALCTQADAAYAAKFAAQVAAHTTHRAVRQLDMEDAEVVPALLLSASPRRRPAPHLGNDDDNDDNDDSGEGGVTVAISSSDPLVAEAMSCSSASFAGHARVEVPPPHVEISGPDVCELPPPPPPMTGGGGAGQGDVFAAQRGEGKKWIRIARGTRARMDEIDIETYQLKELLAQ